MGAFAQCGTASRPGVTPARRTWTGTAMGSAASHELLIGEVHDGGIGGVLLHRLNPVLRAGFGLTSLAGGDDSAVAGL